MAGPFHQIDPTQFSRHWLDVPYADEDPRQVLDIWLPDDGDGPFPLVVFVHGGGWISGDKRENTMPGVFKLPSQGYAVACVEYRLAPQVTWPAPLFDVRAAIRWLRAHGSDYHLKTDKIVAWGNSAGGHILNMVAALGGRNIQRGEHLGNADQSDAIQGLVNLYAPSDMYQIDLCNVLPESAVADVTPGSALNAADTAAEGMAFPHNLIMGFKCSRNPEAAAYGSPIHFVTENFPQAYFLHGTEDVVVPFSQSAAMTNKVNETCHEQRAKLESFSGAGHGHPSMKTDEVVDRIIDFIDAVLWDGPHDRTPLPADLRLIED